MSNILKRVTAVITAASLAVAAAGCGALKNTEIVLTTGLTGDQLFRIGNSVCTLPEAMIYVMDYQEKYESVYGVEMWEHDFGGVTLEEYVKDTIISQLASVKAITLLAKEYAVELSDAETALAMNAAEEYYGALGDELIAYMGIELDDVQGLYEDHVLSEKVYAEITKDVDTEVSDDEARIITVQQIRVESYDMAETIMEKLEEGTDFGTLASAYSRDSQITYTYGRGDAIDEIDSAAFELENDEVSDIIETDDGYYIIKCVNNFDRDATEANKVTLVEKRRDEIFSKVYDELVANTSSEFNSSLWEDVHFSSWEGDIAANFLDIYDKYFE